MDRPELIDPDVVRTWLRAATSALGASRGELDRVNVFPVADGDTGTNMYLTVREASAAVHDTADGASGRQLLRRAARAALLGARGNSGVILSEWLRGLAVAASRGDGLGVGLDVAARSARQAVAHPAPGTILTAADSAAAAARHADAGGMVGPLGAPAHLPVLDAARRGAREAALRSVGVLAPLRDAGVLDAGACGLVLVLDALAAAQRHVDRADAMSEAGSTMDTVLLDMDLRGHRPPPGAAPAEPAPDGAEHAATDEVELMFVLHRPHHASGFRTGAVADALRADLDEVGNSVVVVGGSDGSDGDEGSLWQAHVHTPDLETALEVPRRWARRGEVSRVYVRHLAAAADDWAVVVTTSAPRLAAELASGGAAVLLDLDTAPTVDDVAQTVLGAGTPHVLVLAPEDVLDAGRLAAAVAVIRARDVERDDPGDGAAAPEVTVVTADDDVHLVTAVAALAGALDAAGADGPPDVPRVVRAALARLRTARTTAAESVGVLGGLVAALGSPGIVALLPDADLPAAVLEDLEAAAAALAPDADVVVLPTGRPGAGVGIGVEPGDELDVDPDAIGQGAVDPLAEGSR